MHKSLLLTASLLALLSCGGQPKEKPVETPKDILVHRLFEYTEQGKIAYGHQDDLVYGHNWVVTDVENDPLERSDVRDVTGQYPMVVGFDLGGIEMGDKANLDSVDFNLMRLAAQTHIARGGIVTFSWHPRNPLTGGDAWDISSKEVVASVLERGERHDQFMTEVWNETENLKSKLGVDYNVRETWVEASDGSVYKIVTFVDKAGNRLSTTDIQKAIVSVIEGSTALQNKAKLANIGLPSATLGLMNLSSMDDMSYFGKYVKSGKTAISQCVQELKTISEVKNMELENVQSYIKKAVNVGQYKSTARVMILPPEAGDAVPAVKQRLEYFSF